METVKKYGQLPFQIGLLHGGPGASGGMQYVAEELSEHFGVLELIQTKNTIGKQIDELHKQLTSCADLPIILIGHSWGAWLGLLFTSKYPGLVKKLIIVGSGSLENQYNKDLMKIRLNRLQTSEREKAENLLSLINLGHTDNSILGEFGKLMSIADSYVYLFDELETIHIDMGIFQSVWGEAAKLRDTKALINRVSHIKCPVVAIHGEYDSHPIDGVEIPLSATLSDFKMIRLARCGHSPWKEKYAKAPFFEILQKELIE